jgi:hypothetical protein
VIILDIPIPNISANAKPKNYHAQILNSKSSIDISEICTQKMNQIRGKASVVGAPTVRLAADGKSQILIFWVHGNAVSEATHFSSETRTLGLRSDLFQIHILSI